MQLAVIPVFLAEMAPAHIRGGTGVLYWLAIKVCFYEPLTFMTLLKVV